MQMESKGVKGGAAFHMTPIKGDAMSVVVHDTRTLGTDVGPLHAISQSQRGVNYDYSPKYDFSSLQNNIQDYRQQRDSSKGRRDAEAFQEGVLNLPEGLDLKGSLAMAEKYAEALQKKFGFRKIEGVSVHLDEGRIDADGNKILNRHAHIVFDKREIDKNRMVRLKPNDFREMQNLAAEITGMPRGLDSRKTGAKHLHHKEFKRVNAPVRAAEKEISQARSEVKSAEIETRTAMSESENLRSENAVLSAANSELTRENNSLRYQLGQAISWIKESSSRFAESIREKIGSSKIFEEIRTRFSAIASAFTHDLEKQTHEKQHINEQQHIVADTSKSKSSDNLLAQFGVKTEHKEKARAAIKEEARERGREGKTLEMDKD